MPQDQAVVPGHVRREAPAWTHTFHVGGTGWLDTAAPGQAGELLSEVNVAINNPTGCEFHMLNRGTVPFRPGDVYMLDLSNRHWVVNKSDTARLHMIYHGKVPSRLVQRSYENIYYA